MIIGIAGPTASGKTTVAKMLEEKYDAVRLRYSNFLSEIAKERGLDPEDKATLQELFLTERSTKGEDFLAKEMAKRVAQIENEFIVIEGNRRLVDVETLCQIAETRDDALLLLFIDASQKNRFRRYNERLVEHEEIRVSAEEFNKLEVNDAENEIDDLREIFAKEGLVLNTDDKNADGVFEDIVSWIEDETK